MNLKITSIQVEWCSSLFDQWREDTGLIRFFIGYQNGDLKKKHVEQVEWVGSGWVAGEWVVSSSVDFIFDFWILDSFCHFSEILREKFLKHLKYPKQ